MSNSGIIHEVRVSQAWIIGMRRVHKIIEEEESYGYWAQYTGQHSPMADIIVIAPDLCLPLGAGFDSIVRVYEATNYANPSSYVSGERALRYKNNLLQYKGEKILVCSYEDNLRYIGGRNFFESDGIKVVVKGYQD